jgi:hypothetical protein
VSEGTPKDDPRQQSAGSLEQTDECFKPLTSRLVSNIGCNPTCLFEPAF